jgi:replication initiation protein RepC
MTTSGWRKPTPNLEAAALLAQAGAPESIAKGQCMRAVKRAAPYLGLKAGDVLLLDTLAAFSQKQDWEDGQRAIVWPSNAYLIERTGFALSTLKRHARKLAEAGLIAFKDSPNGKRWGHRDSAGYIVEAYGFDLTPLATRCQALEALADQRELERKACQRLKRQVTVLRRTIRALIDVNDDLTDDAKAHGSKRLDAVVAIKTKDNDLP